MPGIFSRMVNDSMDHSIHLQAQYHSTLNTILDQITNYHCLFLETDQPVHEDVVMEEEGNSDPEGETSDTDLPLVVQSGILRNLFGRNWKHVQRKLDKMTIFGHKMVILVQFTNTVIWTSFYQYDAGKQT